MPNSRGEKRRIHLLLPEYLRYWGLVRVPFSLAPDPAMIFMSRQHHECLLRLQYAIFSNKGGALLVSENAGDGKTSVLTHLKQQLERETAGACRVAFISHPTLSAIQLLQEISAQLGVVAASEDKLQLLNQLRRELTGLRDAGIACVVIVDEGQMLAHRPDILQELRILLNLTLAESFLFTLIFSGQKPLEGVIRAMPEFWQRLPVRYFLGNLDLGDTRALIRHRLQVAGWDPARELFTPAAVARIHAFSEGVPRVICSVADLALLIGFSQRVREVDEMEVTRAASDMDRTGGDGFHYYHFLKSSEEDERLAPRLAGNGTGLRSAGGEKPPPAIPPQLPTRKLTAQAVEEEIPVAVPVDLDLELEPAPAAPVAALATEPPPAPARPAGAATSRLGLARSRNTQVDEEVPGGDSPRTVRCPVCGHSGAAGNRACPGCKSPLDPMFDDADISFLARIQRLPDELRGLPARADLSRLRLVPGEAVLYYHVNQPVATSCFGIEAGSAAQQRCGVALTTRALHAIHPGRVDSFPYPDLTSRSQRSGRATFWRKKVCQVAFKHQGLPYCLWFHFQWEPAQLLARGFVELLIHKGERR